MRESRWIDRRLGVETCAIGITIVTIAALKLGWLSLIFLALSFLVGSSLLLMVRVPWGGQIPLGYTALIVLAQALSASRYTLVIGLALVIIAPITARDDDHYVRRVARSLIVAGAALGATKAVGSLMVAGPAVAHHNGVPALCELLGGGIGVVLSDALFARVWYQSTRMSARSSGPVYLSLVSAGALIGLAYRQGLWLVMIAAGPLLLTRFAFQRYAAAQDTYRQTIQALSIVPEVSGLVSTGHAERTATYANALASALGLSSEAIGRVVTAARLHHIGSISVDDPGVTTREALDSWSLARVAGDILRETGFLASVGALIEEAERGAYAGGSIEAAIVGIASRFDDLVGNDVGRAASALRVVALQNKYDAAQRVVAALRRLLVARPETVTDAIMGAAPLSQVILPMSVVDLAHQG